MAILTQSHDNGAPFTSQDVNMTPEVFRLHIRYQNIQRKKDGEQGGALLIPKLGVSFLPVDIPSCFGG